VYIKTPRPIIVDTLYGSVSVEGLKVVSQPVLSVNYHPAILDRAFQLILNYYSKPANSEPQS